ncbi:hypothetical protein QAD02_009717 [Eretmocerus hayati]|uniref:Uncharacterized protein n=1 Tax=Eretmocerus hayati TaxID=131215 RepID=A0ACC2NAG8_9HYME|nr:hypothetical protein QAD02_009717 [Eretmocerus hayati]
MVISRSAITVFAFTALWLTVKSSSIKNLTKSISFTSNLNVMGLTIQRTSLQYVICHSMHRFQRNCILRAISFSFDETITEEMKCPFTIAVDKDYEMSQSIRVHKIKDHETVLVWGESHKHNKSSLLKIMVISKPDCKIRTNELMISNAFPNIDLTVKNLMVLTHPYTYELIYDDHYDNLANRRKCFVIYDSDGLKYGGPSYLNVSAAPRKSGLLTYRNLYHDNVFKRDNCIGFISEENLNASLFFTEKVSDRLKEFDNAENSRVSVSTAYGFPRICIRENAYESHVKCAQGDLKTWINLTFEHEVQDFIIHNLHDRGFLILVSKRLETNERKFSHQFLLTKFDHNGRVQGGAHVAYSVNCSSPINIHAQIYENEEGDHCVSLLEESTSLYLMVRCFSESTITQQNYVSDDQVFDQSGTIAC